MDDNFDPYLRWLGIRDPQRPPNHYRLLGLELFEGDGAVIATAADRQMTHVRSFQSGRYGDTSQRLLNELAAARLCLLKPDKKGAYDQNLRQSISSSIARPPLGPVSAVVAAAPPGPSSPDSRQELAGKSNSGELGTRAFSSPGKTSLELDFLLPMLTSAKTTQNRPKSQSRLLIVVGVLVFGAISCGVLLWQINRQSTGEIVADGQSRQNSTDNRSLNSTLKPVAESNRADAEPNSSNSIQRANPDAFAVKGTVAGTGEKKIEVPENAHKPTQTNASPKVSAASRSSSNEPPLEDPTIVKIATQLVGGLPIAMSEPIEINLAKSAPTISAQPVKVKAADERWPIPDKAAQVAATKTVHELFKAEYANRKPDERAAFAKKLLQRGEETKDDAAIQYVLWHETIDISTAAGDAQTALQAFDGIAKTFAIKQAEERLALLTELGRPAGRTTDAYRTWFNGLSTLIDNNIDNDDYDLAKRAIALGLSVAKRIPDQLRIGQLTSRARENEQIKKEYDKIKVFIKALIDTPDSPEANQAVGTFYCYFKGDFKRGLPLLAKGPDGELKDLVQKDSANPTSAKEQASVADGWWTVAEGRKDSSRFVLRTHAVGFYRTAIPTLTGLPKSQAELRVKEFEKELFARDQIPPALIVGVLTQATWSLKWATDPNPDPDVRFMPDGSMIGSKYFGKWELRGNHVFCYGGFSPKQTGLLKLVSVDTFTWDFMESGRVVNIGTGTLLRK